MQLCPVCSWQSGRQVLVELRERKAKPIAASGVRGAWVSSYRCVPGTGGQGAGALVTVISKWFQRLFGEYERESGGVEKVRDRGETAGSSAATSRPPVCWSSQASTTLQQPNNQPAPTLGPHFQPKLWEHFSPLPNNPCAVPCWVCDMQIQRGLKPSLCPLPSSTCTCRDTTPFFVLLRSRQHPEGGGRGLLEGGGTYPLWKDRGWGDYNWEWYIQAWRPQWNLLSSPPQWNLQESHHHLGGHSSRIGADAK